VSVLAGGPVGLGLASGLARGLVAEEDEEGLRVEDVVGLVEEEEGFEEDPFVVEEVEASTFRFLLLPVGVGRRRGKG